MVYLRMATDALGRGPLLTIHAVSRVYETAPVEVEEEQPYYLNCVAEVRYDAAAIELLRFCQGIEAALGRERKGEKAPRAIDIDVLLFGGGIMEGQHLVVPHPGTLRAFNLKALADLAPAMYIPGRGVVRELLAGADLEGVRECGEGL